MATNRELAQTDQTFRKACEVAGVYPSRTRYRKFKHRQGRAYEIARTLIDNGNEKGIEISTK